MIKVHVWFSPSLKITDEIKNTSLKDLIKANKGKLSDRHQSLYEDYCDYDKALSTKYGFQWRGDAKLDYQYYSVLEEQCFYYYPTSGFEDFRRKNIGTVVNPIFQVNSSFLCVLLKKLSLFQILPIWQKCIICRIRLTFR